MESFNSDFVLHVVQYLDVVDSGRLASCSKRYYYLVHQYRQLSGPELVTSASWDPTSKTQLGSKEVVQNGIRGLQKEPNFVLAFSNPRSALSDELPRRLNSNAVTLGAIAGDLQVNQESNVEHKSNASVMLANFPNAVVTPFAIEYGPHVEDDIESLKSTLEEKGDVGWKAMIVYACGQGNTFAESFVSKMQRVLPDAAIVGGICAAGYVSSPGPHTKQEFSKLSIRQLKKLNRSLGGADKAFLEKYELVNHVFQLSQNRSTLIQCEDTVFGVVLGGDAPVRSMVSRGVESVIQGSPQSSSPFVVETVELSRPGDDSYLFRGNGLKPMHMIQQVRNKETDKVLSAATLIAQVANTSDFIGLKRPSQDGFELHQMSPYCQMAEQFLIMTDGSAEEDASLLGAEIDFFSLSGTACLSHMDATVTKLKEQTQGEKILGAVMFSCNGRGPQRGALIAEKMADATRFSNGFPHVPCLGFYAGGEIGPLALAGNEKVFQTGRVALQGFTAVFALFIVPVVERLDYHLDDSQDNVLNFVNSRLSSS
jgi:small ligand-binding sensory domain FIST